MRAAGSGSGFALVEALAALILLSVALGGSVALLVQAVRQERTAGERGRALRHAASLADALRALRRSDGQPLQAVTAPGAVAVCPDQPADCILESQAARQIDAWGATLEEDMPSGVEGAVGWVPDAAGAYSISVTWPAAGDAPEVAVRLLVQS